MRRGALALHALWSRLEANRKNTRFGKELEARRRRWPRSTPPSRAFSPASPTAPTRSRPTNGARPSRRRQKRTVPELPPIEAAWPTLQVADAAVERWVELRVRVMMRLAALAEAADFAAPNR